MRSPGVYSITGQSAIPFRDQLNVNRVGQRVVTGCDCRMHVSHKINFLELSDLFHPKLCRVGHRPYIY